MPRWLRAHHTELAIALVVVASMAAHGAARSETCTREQLTQVIDASDEALRRVNQDSGPRLQAQLLKLKEKKGWGEDDYEAKAYEFLENDKIRALDDQSKLLLAKVDELGDDKTGEPTCARMAELQATFSELKATVQAKFNTQIAILDRELADSAIAARSAPAAEPVAAAANPGATLPAATVTPPQLRPSMRENATIAAAPPPAPAKPVIVAAPAGQPGSPDPWTSKTLPAPTPPAGQMLPQASVAVLPPPAPLPPPMQPSPDAPDATYSIEEIRAAGRGFFGSASAELAAILNYAFQKAGRPNAYILGDEGGGAFVAGLRFGKGVLHMKSGLEQKVFWRGPSIGYDFGADGARTMYLVYKLDRAEDLYATFAGINGSAYLVGGAGITFLKKGDIVLAPIRTGLGLRLGANVGYLKFTPKQSWNPF